MTIEPTLIDARCFCDKCRDRTEDIYRMISALCINCGAGPFLILYRAGDKAHARDCPVCGTYWSVKPSRLATDDEIPIVAAHLGSGETAAKAAALAVPSDSSPSSPEARHGVAQALVDKVREALHADPAISGDAQRAHDAGFSALDTLLGLIDELADRLYESAATADRRQGTIDKLTLERDVLQRRLDDGDLTRLRRALRAEARVEALKAACALAVPLDEFHRDVLVFNEGPTARLRAALFGDDEL